MRRPNTSADTDVSVEDKGFDIAASKFIEAAFGFYGSKYDDYAIRAETFARYLGLSGFRAATISRDGIMRHGQTQ
jgi:hypothetical protein